MLLFMLLGSGHAFAQSLSLNLDSGVASKGGAVSLNLSLNISSGSAPGSLAWTLSYPPGDITGFLLAAGPSLTAASKTLNCVPATGLVSCVASGMHSTTIGSGVVAVVTATLASTTTSATDSVLVSNVMGAYPDGTFESSTATGGIITLVNPSPAPTITGLSPASATAGTAGFGLTVNGSGFVNGSAVNWNGASRPTAFVSSTRLMAAITAADIAHAGTAQVTVFNPAPGGGTATTTFPVTMDAVPPVISIASPTSGASVNGSLTVKANATDNVGIASVQFRLDGANLGSAVTGSGPTYSAVWNTTSVANGAHTLTATAVDFAGNTGVANAVSATVNNPILLLHLDSSEVSGTTNGSTVTPSIAPAGFTGSVMVNGSGSVNYAPAQTGNGVYFLNCCSNANNAYYKFTSAALASIFGIPQGHISFTLNSRYSFSQRQSSAAYPRYAFDVRDGNGQHQLYFRTQVVSGALMFYYMIGGTIFSYTVPSGTEDQLFGSGVNLAVALNWNGNTANLYLNGVLAKSTSYVPAASNWNAVSNFDLGAFEYGTAGGYDTCDDLIDEFAVLASPTP